MEKMKPITRNQKYDLKSYAKQAEIEVLHRITEFFEETDKNYDFWAAPNTSGLGLSTKGITHR